MINFKKTLLAFNNRISLFAQAAGIIAYAGLQWLVLIRLLPIGGYTLVGNYALAQAVVAPVIGFFAFSMRPLWVSGAINEISAGNVLFVRIVTGALALIVAIGINLIFGMRINIIIFTYVLISKFLDTISDILSGIFDRQGKSSISGLLLIMKSALLSLLIIIGWILQFDLFTTILTLIIFQSFAVFVEWKISGATHPSNFFNSSKWITIFPLGTAFFAALNSLVASLSGFFPRYLLEFFSNRETVGYFSTIYIPVLMIQMVATGLSQTHLYKLSKIVRLGNLKRIIIDSAHVTLIISGLHVAITIIAFISVALSFWVWKDQRTLLQDMAIVLAVSLPLGVRQFYSYLAMSGGRMTAVFVSSFVILAVQLIFASWAIRTGGILGCVILMSLGAAIHIAIYLWILHRPSHPVTAKRYG